MHQNEAAHYFHKAVLEHYVQQFNFANLEVDVALRTFLESIVLRSEAQKIERIIEAFANRCASNKKAKETHTFACRYYSCNAEASNTICVQMRSADDVFLVAYALIMLNTDLHNPSLKEKSRMKIADFIQNLRRALPHCTEVQDATLKAIYMRIKEKEFKPGRDHVTDVQELDRSVLGAKKPQLALPHRRLKCYCRLHEIDDINRKQSEEAHTRDIFLFNDLMLITKATRKDRPIGAKESTYQYRSAHSLHGMEVQEFRNQHYAHGLTLVMTHENTRLHLNARSADDRAAFIKDVRDAIDECSHMECTRVELELSNNSLLRVIRPQMQQMHAIQENPTRHEGEQTTVEK